MNPPQEPRPHPAAVAAWTRVFLLSDEIGRLRSQETLVKRGDKEGALPADFAQESSEIRTQN